MDKPYTIEELRQMRLLQNTDGRPTHLMTDERWQREFYVWKSLNNPKPRELAIKFGGKYSKIGGKDPDKYQGASNYQSYCAFMNDVLRNIRKGNRDYCFYVYQVTDLLEYEPGLCSRFTDDYWEVWLEEKDR